MTIKALLEAAHAAWPDVRVDEREFSRLLAERILPHAPAAPGVPATLCAKDLFLAFACARGDAAALYHLEARFLSRLPIVLRSIEPSPSFAEEVVQLVRIRLLLRENGSAPRILDYGGRGPLRGWLRAVALRIALNLSGLDRRECDLDSVNESSLIAGALDPEQALLKSQMSAHFREAFRVALASLTADERNLFRLHLVEGLSIDRLAEMHRIHRSTAARRAERLKGLLLERTRRHLADFIGLAGEEVDSALKSIRNGWDLSLP